MVVLAAAAASGSGCARYCMRPWSQDAARQQAGLQGAVTYHSSRRSLEGCASSGCCFWQRLRQVAHEALGKNAAQQRHGRR